METDKPQEMDPNVLKDIVKTLHRLEARLEHQAARLNSIDHSVRSSVSRTGSAILNTTTTTTTPSVEKLAAEYRDTITRLWDRFDFVNDSHSELRFDLLSRAATRHNTTSFSTAAAAAAATAAAVASGGDARDATITTVCASPVDMELDEDDDEEGEDDNNRRPSFSIYSSSRGQSRSRVILGLAAPPTPFPKLAQNDNNNLPLQPEGATINKNKLLPPDPPPSGMTPVAVRYEHTTPPRLTSSRAAAAATATRLMMCTTSTRSGSENRDTSRKNDNQKKRKNIIAVMEKWINTSLHQPEGVKDSLRARSKRSLARLRDWDWVRGPTPHPPPSPPPPRRPSSLSHSPLPSASCSSSSSNFSGDVNVTQQQLRQQKQQHHYCSTIVVVTHEVVNTCVFALPRRCVNWAGRQMVSQQLKGFDRGRF